MLRDGLACNEAVVSDGKAVGGNPLDRALWQAPGAARVAVGGAKRLDVRPFDYERRLNSVLILEDGGERRIIVKGAPEAVMARSTAVAPQAKEVLQDLFAQGSRVVAVATRNANGQVKLIRQHDEVRDDGNVIELREHVQRRSGVAVP